MQFFSILFSSAMHRRFHPSLLWIDVPLISRALPMTERYFIWRTFFLGMYPSVPWIEVPSAWMCIHIYTSSIPCGVAPAFSPTHATNWFLNMQLNSGFWQIYPCWHASKCTMDWSFIELPCMLMRKRNWFQALILVDMRPSVPWIEVPQISNACPRGSAVNVHA